MVFGYPVVFTQMAFRLIPKVLNAIDVIVFVYKKLTMGNTIVLKLRHIQGVVGTIIVRIDNAIRHNLLTDDGQKRLGFGIRNYLCVDFASALQNAEDWDLACRTTPSLAFASATKVGLIHLNRSSKRPFLFDLLGND